MRKEFCDELHKSMAKDNRIIIIAVNLGYNFLDQIRKDYPNRFIDTGVSEQAAMGMAVGLVSEGKIPVVYTITSFLLYRPFEIIRNYINYYKYPVKLGGTGRDKDYSHDGMSHWSEDAKYFLDGFPNIVQFWPDNEGAITQIMNDFLYNQKPSFISLRR